MKQLTKIYTNYGYNRDRQTDTHTHIIIDILTDREK